ncbi:DNA repair protein recA homolog 2, mitochondrial [Linum perenne]
MVGFIAAICLNSFGSFRFFHFQHRCSKSQNGRRYLTSGCRGKAPASYCSLAGVPQFEFDEVTDNGKASKKDYALRLALSQLDSETGGESMSFQQRFFSSRNAPVISTGSLRLDLALGNGGLPKGRMVEIYGQESSGKTILALHIIKEAQKRGGYCAYLDVENALDSSIVEAVGVNTDNLLISPPDSAENMLSMVNTLTKSGSVDVIVVDSVRSSVGSALFRHAEEVTCAGNALKFYSAVRLRMRRKKLLKNDERVTGLGVCVEVVKNKLGPAMKTAELEIEFGRGFCRRSEVLELGTEYGLIAKEGSSYIIRGRVFDSELAAWQHLAEQDCVLDEIVANLRSLCFQR